MNFDELSDDFIVLDKKLITLITIDIIKLSSRIIVNFDYFHYFFANRFIFIIYEIIYSRLIKNIEDS